MKISGKDKLNLPILIEQDEDNYYIVSCPVFKGCHSYGESIEEALGNIREVIDICIAEEKEQTTIKNRYIGVQEIEFPIDHSSA